MTPKVIFNNYQYLVLFTSSVAPEDASMSGSWADVNTYIGFKTEADLKEWVVANSKKHFTIVKCEEVEMIIDFVLKKKINYRQSGV